MEIDDYTVIPRIYLEDAKGRGLQFDEYIQNQSKYPANVIKTTKYTKWNFIPLNIFHQERFQIT